MEDWMTDHEVPDDLQNCICWFFEYKCIATQDLKRTRSWGSYLTIVIETQNSTYALILYIA